VPRCPVDERAAIPIGTACAGEDLLILDADLRPVATGEIGELYIRGVGLSPGYWRNPEKTQEVFLRYPGSTDPGDRVYRTGDLARRGADGLIYFHGRSDTQIKSRGYRIELGEIETALNAVPGLQESAVVAVQSEGFEGWLICCAYVPAPGRQVSTAAVRDELAKLLPAYMLPMRWMKCRVLPKTDSGKVDRVSLKNAFLRTENELAQAGTPPPEGPAKQGWQGLQSGARN
jgi:acyl-coenzyme A synthetase/AMP-(fatty) acid ligase